MTQKEFENVVRDALKKLPKYFRDKLQNIDIVIEEGTGDGEFTGLYEGVPLTERSEGGALLPDKITLFKREIEIDCEENGLDIRVEIADIVRHEIAHHFGISDERLEDLGAY